MRNHLSKFKSIYQNVAAAVTIGFVILTGEYLFLSQLAKFGW